MFNSRRASVAALVLLIAACSSTDPEAGSDGPASGGARAHAGSAGKSSDGNAQAGQDEGSHEGGAAGARDPDTTDPIGASGEGGTPNEDGGDARGGASANTAGASTAGMPAGGASTAGAGGSSSGAAGSTSGAAGNPNDNLMIPCDVYAALAICRNCHTEPLAGGAPFPLLTLHDLQLASSNAYGAISTGEMPLGGGLAA